MSNYKKYKIIILYPQKFRKFDIERYEIEFFKKKFDVEIHDFSKLLYPKYISSFKKNYISDKKLKSFKSLEKWKKYIQKLMETKKKIFVLNFLSLDSFKVFKILFFIKKMNIKRMDFLNFGMPNYSHEKNLISFYDNYKNKLKELILRTRFLLGNLKGRISQYFFNIISFFFFRHRARVFICCW